VLQEELWTIDVTDDGNVLIVASSGELDITTSVELTDAFACANGHTELVCDISGPTFIDSSGICVSLVPGARRRSCVSRLPRPRRVHRRLSDLDAEAGAVLIRPTQIVGALPFEETALRVSA
jgi:hypothetical protein